MKPTVNNTIALKPRDFGLASLLPEAELEMVEAAWNDAGRLVGFVKNYARASTAAKALCGLRLRALREYYFGKVTVGRPRKQQVSGCSKTWNEMLVERLGIEERTARNWIKLASIVEGLAERDGISLREICEKLPWDWTPEETQLMTSTVEKITADKTQRELLQSDFLSDLGYQEPERPNASNNPTGKNGGKKPILNYQERLDALRCLARKEFFGSADLPHKPQFGSPAGWMMDFSNRVFSAKTPGDKNDTPLEALTRQELQLIWDDHLKPFVDAWKELLSRHNR